MCVCTLATLLCSCGGITGGETQAPGSAVKTPNSNITVRINEYASKGSLTFTDADSEYVPWVELFNSGDKDVSLSGMVLTDKELVKDGWSFPDVSIPAGGYLIVILAGKAKAYAPGGELHADFTLNGKEPALTLYSGNAVVDSCAVHDLVSNVTFGRSGENADTWLFFPKATPGAANTVAGFPSIDSAKYPASKDVAITEVVAVNATLSAAPDGMTYSRGELYDYYDLYDYVELCNTSGADIVLSDYKINDSENPTKAVVLPEYTLKSGEYAVLYCDNETKYVKSTGKLYIDMGVNRYGETLYILDSSDIVVDTVKTGTLFDGTSSGRCSMYDDTVYFFEQTTPGKENPVSGLGASCPAPVINTPGGRASSGTQVSITAPSGCSVYYTLDGSAPDKSSTLYTAPITLNGSLTLRAVSVRAGYLNSEDVSASYLVDEEFSFPVVFLSTEDENLFSPKSGILANGVEYKDVFPYTDANYWEDWERPIHFDYIDNSGQQVLSFNAGIKVFGQFSRAMDQKSLAIVLKDKYGPKEVCYPFFDDCDVNVFSALILRNGGQDGKYAHLRDAFIRQVVNGQIDVETMAYRPVIVYINGQYFGIYDLREKVDENYLANHRGIDPENIDLIKGSNIVLEGSMDEYREIRDFVCNNPMAVESNYLKACEKIDIDSLINFWICETFFGNTDPWNVKFYCEKTDSGKWRWILYDLDWGLWNSTYYSYNMFSSLIGKHGAGALIKSLLENPGFKQKFLTTYNTYLDTVFTTERMLSIFEPMVKQLEPEMERHIQRWSEQDDPYKLTCTTSMKSWYSYVSTLRKIINDANAETRKDLAEYF